MNTKDMATKDIWAGSDPLGSALHHLRMSGAFYCRSELTAPWGATMPSLPDCLMFHVVTAGRCWLEVDGDEGRLLQPGDFALVSHACGHRLLSEPGAPAPDLFDLPRDMLSDRYEVLRHGGGGEPTLLVCGAVHFDEPAARRLVQHLPRVLVVNASSADHPQWLHASLRVMADEARAWRPGGEAVMTRLADILVIQAIRSWMASDPLARTGWLGALQDERIGRALAAIHRQPAHAWTLTALAGLAAMSRSAFAARFTQQVGVPAMQYVTQWRMAVAQSMLREGHDGLATLAGRVGYQSEAAFNRAFKRHVGMPPGAVAKGAVPGAPVR